MPPAYTSAVSKNVTPASNEFLTSASASFWPSPPIDCHMPLLSPNVIVPRQTSDTSKPVRPSFLYRIVLLLPGFSPCQRATVAAIAPKSIESSNESSLAGSACTVTATACAADDGLVPRRCEATPPSARGCQAPNSTTAWPSLMPSADVLQRYAECAPAGAAAFCMLPFETAPGFTAIAIDIVRSSIVALATSSIIG